MATYSTDDVLPSPLLNGHILFIFLQNQFSVGTTDRLIREQLCPGSQGNFVYQIRRMDEYKKLSDVKEMKLFEAVCALQFDTSKLYIATTAQPKSSHEMKSDVAHSSVDVVVTRQIKRCTSCKYLRKQLHTARLKLLAHKQQQKYIQCDLKRIQADKVLNQKLKRKDLQIVILKKQLRHKDESQELQETKRVLLAVRRRHAEPSYSM